MLWQTDDVPEERPFDFGKHQARSPVPPTYLLDGQQRLTSLHRALRRDDHLDPSKFIEIVFNVVTEEFKNESAATKKDRRWVRVAEIAAPDADLFDMAEQCFENVGGLERRKVQSSLSRLHHIRDHDFHIETLSGSTTRQSHRYSSG